MVWCMFIGGRGYNGIKGVYLSVVYVKHSSFCTQNCRITINYIAPVTILLLHFMLQVDTEYFYFVFL